MAVQGFFAESRQAEDFKSIYINGAQFTGTGDDVRFHFWTNEIVPAESEPVEAPAGEVKLQARMRLIAKFRSEVIMPFSVFEKFAEMVAQQYAIYKKAREGGST